MMSNNYQRHQLESLCAQLEASDPSMTDVSVRVCMNAKGEEDLERICEKLKKNVTVESVTVTSGAHFSTKVLSFRSMLALYAAVHQHPSIKKLSFSNLSLAELVLGPIVLAVLENDRLKGLSLSSCTFPSPATMMESLNVLLEKDALESLHIGRYRSSEGVVGTLDLSVDALANAKRLRKLQLSDITLWDSVFVSSKTVSGIALLLRCNPGLQVFELIHANLTSRMVQCIAEAATGHPSLQEVSFEQRKGIDDIAAQAIGEMIGNTPCLRDMKILKCFMGRMTASRIFEGLKSKECALERLNIRCSNIGDDGAVALGSALETNSSVKELFMPSNNIGHVGASALATALTKNKTLEDMFATSNNFGPKGTTAIADALCSNHSMERINLQRNGMGDVGAVAISNMLTMNASLTNVTAGDFGERGLNAFIEYLPQMEGLEYLTIAKAEGYTADAANALVHALEQNTVLTWLELDYDLEEATYPPAIEEIWPKVVHLLTLNRAGRRYLKETTPRSYWPYILAKSANNPDVLYHFVREVPPNDLFTNTRTKKRKREEGTIWSSLLDSPRDLFDID